MSTALMIPAETRTELATEASAAEDFIEAIEAIDIQTQDDLAFAERLLIDVKSKFKALEERRTAITKPINAAKREVDALFDPVQKPLKRAEPVLKDKIGAYHIRAEEARMAALPAVAAGEVSPLALAPTEHAKGVSVREVWDFEVTDPNAVPREYLCVNELALADLARKGAPVEIPGIRFFKRAELRVRT